MEGLKEGLVIPGFLFVDEPYKALSLTAKVVLGLLIGCMRPDKEAAGEMVVCIKQDDIGAILNISRHTYRRALQSLAGCGLIEVTRGTGGPYEYSPLPCVSKFTVECIKTSHSYVSKFSTA